MWIASSHSAILKATHERRRRGTATIGSGTARRRGPCRGDIARCQKIVVAMRGGETIRLMKEIDEVIEKHGGWPGALVTTPPK
jgi:hypothetical protein